MRRQLGFSAIYGPCGFEEPDAPFAAVSQPLLAQVRQAMQLGHRHHQRDTMWNQFVGEMPMTLADLNTLRSLAAVTP